MHDVIGDLLMCSWGDTLDAVREEHRLNTPERIRDQLLEWKEKYQMAGLVWRQERWLAGAHAFGLAPSCRKVYRTR